MKNANITATHIPRKPEIICMYEEIKNNHNESVYKAHNLVHRECSKRIEAHYASQAPAPASILTITKLNLHICILSKQQSDLRLTKIEARIVKHGS